MTAGSVATARRTDRSAEVTLDARVVAKEPVAADTVRLVLDPVGEPLPTWEPGAHIDLRLRPDLVRQYSLCGDPEAPYWEVAVLREPDGKGGSRHVHEDLAVGDVVEVRGPRNHFSLAPAEEYLFIAGGIGITPILPMLRVAQASRTPWRLVYGGRTESSMAFRDELQALYGDLVSLHPQDETGLLDLASLVSACSAATQIYSCGPAGMLGALEALCTGDTAPRLHVERFVPRELDPSIEDNEFEVVLERSGLKLTVPVGRSVLEVVEDAGIYVESQCRAGTCGTCETDVLYGEPDHRDSLLDEDERASCETMMICVSRARCPRLVLNL
ncbi:PDR/VanB family oxidoreductase [Georgenia daeguensis]|uniref:PDR/VanB family oxidoreductase n=2 Tax=Georgenia daeguensis TaxID=908355 RepID=A0ABP6UK23_9MICO